MARYGKDVILDFSLWEYEDREAWRQRILGDSMHWHPSPDHPVLRKQDSDAETSDSRCSIDTVMDSYLVDPAYRARYCSPFVRVQLHYADCPVSTCRDRLIRRNRVCAASTTSISFDTPPNTPSECEEKAYGKVELECCSDARGETCLSASPTNTLPVAPYVLNRSHCDHFNFHIGVETFDKWSSLMERPRPNEFAVVWRDGECMRDTAFEDMSDPAYDPASEDVAYDAASDDMRDTAGETAVSCGARVFTVETSAVHCPDQS